MFTCALQSCGKQFATKGSNAQKYCSKRCCNTANELGRKKAALPTSSPVVISEHTDGLGDIVWIATGPGVDLATYSYREVLATLEANENANWNGSVKYHTPATERVRVLA